STDADPSAEAGAFPGRGGARGWLLVAVCLATLLLSYLLVAALLACVVGTADGARFEPPAILLAAVAAWLACFQVPLTLDGAALGALPLLPTALIAVLVAAAASAYARRCRLHR